ncbi:hypothetical protein BC831DRAFT_513675 [Entophlyctis helioformis]|nr:hypothetical protein BC831DRAFT_513675 [Entophlyctis helioformis]
MVTRRTVLTVLALAAAWALVPNAIKYRLYQRLRVLFALFRKRGGDGRRITASPPRKAIASSAPPSTAASAASAPSAPSAAVNGGQPQAARDAPQLSAPSVNATDASTAVSRAPSGVVEPLLGPISGPPILLSSMTITDLLSRAGFQAAKYLPPPRPGDKPHRHTQTVATNMALLADLEPLDHGWNTTLPETNGVAISTVEVAGVDLPFIRGDGIIFGNWSLEEVLSVVRSGAARKMWDPRFDSSQVIDTLSPNDLLLHTVQKGTFPVSARDFVTLSSVFWMSPTKVIYNSSSVHDSKGPPDGLNGRVRGELLVAGWILARVQYGIKASYIVHVDPKGSVPSTLIKMVQQQTPMCIANVAKYLEPKARFHVQLRREDLMDGGVHIEITMRTVGDKSSAEHVGDARRMPMDDLVSGGWVSASATAHVLEFWVKEFPVPQIHVDIQVDLHKAGVVFNGTKIA